jgi:predicted RNA-binding Zn-ribbon protein involved in translation (DUF1610 family)
MVVERIPSLKVVCPHCNVPMQEQSEEAAVIQLSTRTKTVVYECPKCGAETERQIAIPSDRAGNRPAGLDCGVANGMISTLMIARPTAIAGLCECFA